MIGDGAWVGVAATPAFSEYNAIVVSCIALFVCGAGAGLLFGKGERRPLIVSGIVGGIAAVLGVLYARLSDAAVTSSSWWSFLLVLLSAVFWYRAARDVWLLPRTNAAGTAYVAAAVSCVAAWPGVVTWLSDDAPILLVGLCGLVPIAFGFAVYGRLRQSTLELSQAEETIAARVTRDGDELLARLQVLENIIREADVGRAKFATPPLISEILSSRHAAEEDLEQLKALGVALERSDIGRYARLHSRLISLPRLIRADVRDDIAAIRDRLALDHQELSLTKALAVESLALKQALRAVPDALKNERRAEALGCVHRARQSVRRIQRLSETATRLASKYKVAVARTVSRAAIDAGVRAAW